MTDPKPQIKINPAEFRAKARDWYKTASVRAAFKRVEEVTKNARRVQHTLNALDRE
jgi:hypothetical protein